MKVQRYSALKFGDALEICDEIIFGFNLIQRPSHKAYHDHVGVDFMRVDLAGGYRQQHY